MLAAALATIAGVPLAAHFATAVAAAARNAGLIEGTVNGKAEPFRPFISLLRPVLGLDPHDRETLESSFLQDYPGYEVIFCAASTNDPVCAVVRELIAMYPEVPARLLVGDNRATGNPKLNNLLKGVAAAASDWMVMADANLLLGPDYLTGLADAWHPGTGLVSGPALGTRYENFWGALEAAFLNTSQARWQLAADAVGYGFAQGKTLFWNRRILEAGGGLLALGGELAEDVASTKLVRAQRLRVRLPAKLSAQPIGWRTARAVWDRQLRWNRTRRAGFPGLFVLEVALGPLLSLASLAALVALGAAPLWTPALFVALWYGAEIGFARAIGLALSPRDLAAMLMRDALLPALWIATFVRRGFDWRGTAMGAAGEPAE